MVAGSGVPHFDAPDLPTGVRITHAASIVSWLLFANPVASAIWGVLVVLTLSVVLTRPLRDGYPAWLGIVVIVVAFGAVAALVVPLARLYGQRWYGWLVFGKPRFWPIESPGRWWFATTLKCVGSIELRWKSEDEQLISKIGRLSADGVKELIHRKYLRYFDESSWEASWERMQRFEEHGVTFGEAIRSGRYEIVSNRFAVVGKLVRPLFAVFWIGYIWLLTDVIRGASTLALIQFSLIAGFATAALVFVSFTVSLGAVTVTRSVAPMLLKELEDVRGRDPDFAQWMDEWTSSDAAQELADHEGDVLLPAVKVREGYVEAVRNAFIRQWVVGGLSEFFVVLLPLIVTTWLIALPVSNWTNSEVNNWTTGMLLGSAAAPLVFSSVIGIAFFVLARFRILLGLIAAAVFLALVPPLVSYAMGGEIGPQAVVSSLIAGASGIISTAIAELVKKRPTATQVT